MKSFMGIAFLFSFYIAVKAQHTVKPADSILQEAYKRAAKENKNVFIIFHASWCGWCRLMDYRMNDVSCKTLFAGNYVICHLTVDESPDKKNTENPGAPELQKKYHAENAGLPFWLILDKNGKLLADSKIRPEGAGLEVEGQNTGCPSTKAEVAYFIEVLKNTSSLTAMQLAIIEKRFSKK